VYAFAARHFLQGAIMTNAALSLLGIRFPIIQAPMAGVSTIPMAAAVCEAGGLGSVAVGAGTPAQARAAIADMRNLTGKPFNVNVFCHRPAQADPAREARWLEYLAPHFAAVGAAPPVGLKEIYKSFVNDEEMLDVFLAERPAVVSFHFGLPPQRYIDALKGAGIVLMASATTVEEAQQVEQAGIDLLVAQGVEAGGHRGVFDSTGEDAGIGTFALVRLLARSVKLPVIAAGGIMDGQGIAAAMALGASAAQLGTAFILCPESSANAHFRSRMKSGETANTMISPVISGRAARGLPNKLFDDIGASGHPPVPDYPIAYDAVKSLSTAAAQKGVQDYAVNWAGQGAPLTREMPAAELVRVLAEELRAALPG
jgi:nitronate monooxygenase